MIKLKNKVILLFALFSLAIILLTNIISNALIKNNFNHYIKDAIEERKESIIEEVSSTYSYGKWNIKTLDKIGLSALDNGLIIKVSDIDGKVIWDANNNYGSMCQMMLDEMSSNMGKINPNNKEEYIEESYKINKGILDIGTISIGYSGPIYYNNSDIMFFKALNITLIIVSLLAIILSIIIGIIISSTISKPILNMVSSAKEISKGNYNKKLKSNNNIKELNEMISSINELSNSLQKDEEIRKMLTRDISHELRTPLTTIGLQIESLIDKVWEPTEERLLGIQSEILRLTRLVKSLEELSQYDNSSLILKKEKVDMQEMITSLVINFETQALDKNIKINKHLTSVVSFIDRDKVSQCIINLLSNSLKYTEANGTIDISLLKDNKNVYISIKDTGIGISSEHLNNIFKRFYRVDSSRARKTGGVGVGLTISKSIIEAHGGDIHVKSKLNEGSEFIILIPLLHL